MTTQQILKIEPTLHTHPLMEMEIDRSHRPLQSTRTRRARSRDAQRTRRVAGV